jgi:MFS family permease
LTRSGTISLYDDARVRNARRLMWFLLISLHLITFFHRVSFNVVADLLSSEFSLTGVGLGNLAAAYTYMYVLMQIPGGILVDRLGPRRIALLTGLSMAAGSIVIGLATNSALVFFGRMLIGFGGSVVLINIFKFQASWYRPTEFATMSGLALLISTSGALLAATPLALAVGLTGWRNTFIWFGLFTMAVAFICWFFVRDTPGSRFSKFLTACDDCGTSDQPSLISFSAVKTVLSNHRLWLPFMINFGVYGGFIVFAGTWGISYLVHGYGISVEEASGFMIFAYLGYMIGAPAAGAISDLTGSRRLPALVLVSCSVIFWLMLAAWPDGILPLWLIYGLSALVGFGGAATVLSFPMAREVSISGHTGLVTATVNLGVFLGMAILQPLFGYVLDKSWTGLIVDGARIYSVEAYRQGFLVALIFSLVSLTAAFIYRDTSLKENVNKCQ